MDNPLLLNFVSIVVFSLMLTIGVNHSLKQLTGLWRQPELLFRSLLAVIVLVPVVVIVLLWMFDLPPEVATALAVLAAAPGAPLTTKRSQMAGADPAYVSSLQLAMALLAVIVTPCILGIFYTLFELETERVTALKVAGQISMVTFLPVVIGLLLRQLAPKLVEVIGKPLNVLANVMFLLLLVLMVVLLVIAPELRMKMWLGTLPMITIVLMVALSLAIGHFLGGPPRNQRTGLAVACIARNVGLAMFIVGLSNTGQNYIPTVLTYMILGSVVAIPYSVWNKRQMKAKSA